MNKFILIVTSLLIIFTVVNNFDRVQNQHYFHVTFGARSFDVPFAYLERGGSASPTGILITFYYPDLRPLSELSEAEYKNALKAERFGQALIEPITARYNYDINRLRPQKSEHVVKSKFAHGLNQEIWHFGAGENAYKKLVYYPNPSNETEEFIICSDDRMPHPVCSYYFKADDLFFLIDFSRRNELHHWREIRQRVEGLIKAFEITQEAVK